MVASAAVQLTLGLETWDLEFFQQILIYPGEYKNPQTNLLHKGETNMGGFMCFSWKDFLRGNEVPDDKINLGLHEFGHALRFSGIQGTATDYFFDNYFKRWLACASREYTRMKKGNSSILRKYGSVNINEFFSVVVETFFERPLEFKSKLPELFHHTSILLNQTVDHNGIIQLNCKEELLKKNVSVGIKSYNNVLRYILPNTGKIYGALIFGVFGGFTLLDEGYKHPPAYILIFIASLFWMRIEEKYTRVEFQGKTMMIRKGFLLTKNYVSKTIPISQLVSFYVNYSSLDDDFDVESAKINYYYEGDFYEEDLHFKFVQPQFDVFCRELIDNFVHVHIV